MTDATDRQAYLQGNTDAVDLNTYLQDGVLHYPGTASFGTQGNAVVVGHSSYYKNDPGRYKTVFQAIIGLDLGDEVWVYVRQPEGTYQQYVYTVLKSYETSPDHGEIFTTERGKNLTLITCTPIGTTSARRVVQARILEV